jgi:hypothetical protein
MGRGGRLELSLWRAASRDSERRPGAARDRATAAGVQESGGGRRPEAKRTSVGRRWPEARGEHGNNPSVREQMRGTGESLGGALVGPRGGLRDGLSLAGL